MTDYYMSDSLGNDGYNGLFPIPQGGNDGPWQTIGTLNSKMSNTIVPGDSVYFMTGDTFGGPVGLIMRKGGTETSQMILGAYEIDPSNPSPKPIYAAVGPIQGGAGAFSYLTIRDFQFTTPDSWIAINIHNLGYGYDFLYENLDFIGCRQGMNVRVLNGYEIRNCHFLNCSGHGLAVIGQGSMPIVNGYIHDCTFNNCAEGIMFHDDHNNPYAVGPNHLVEHCSITGCVEGLDVASGTDIIISDCDIFANGGLHNITIAHNTERITIDGCRILNAAGNTVGVYPSTDCTIKNCLIDGGAYNLIVIGDPGGQYGGDLTNLTIQNNVIRNRAGGGSLIVLHEDIVGGPRDVDIIDLLVENNIFINDETNYMVLYVGDATPTNTGLFTNNSWWRTNQDPEPFALDNGTVRDWAWWQSYYPTDTFEEPCAIHDNQTDCEDAGCYWWSDGTCNSTPEGQPLDCVNPVGTHGQVDPCGDGGANQPLTTHSYLCNDGLWEQQSENCPFCPDCGVPPLPCTNPVGEHGEVHPCGDGRTNQPLTTHSYLCNDGLWEQQSENCPTCPDCAAPPPPEIPWIPIIVAGTVAVTAVGIGIIILLKR